MSLFNFKQHAAKATESMREEKATSVRELEGVTLDLEVRGMFRKVGENPKVLKSSGKYTSVGFKFVLRGVGRLPESTDEQIAAAEALIGQDVILITNLKGDPNDDQFGVINDRNLQTLLRVAYAALYDKVQQAQGVAAAKEFKNPMYKGSYATEKERQETLNTVSQTLEDAFAGQEGLLVGATILCKNRKGNEKKDGSGDFWYNDYYEPLVREA